MREKERESEMIDLNEEPDNNIVGGFAAKKEPLDKGAIIMEAWRDTIKKREREMVRGFWKPVFNMGQFVFNTWSEDTRNGFISSVIALECVLAADLDVEYIKYRKDAKEEEKEKWNFFAYKEYIEEKDSNGNTTKKLSFICMPEAGSVIKPDRLDTKGWWDNNINQWTQFRLDLYTEILGELSKLLKRLKYFGKDVKFA